MCILCQSIVGKVLTKTYLAYRNAPFDPSNPDRMCSSSHRLGVCRVVYYFSWWMSIFEMLSTSYSEGMRTKWFSFTENVQCLRTRNILSHLILVNFFYIFYFQGADRLIWETHSVTLSKVRQVSIVPSVCPSVCLTVCLSAFLPACLPACLLCFVKKQKTVL